MKSIDTMSEKVGHLIAFIQRSADDPDLSEGEMREHLRRCALTIDHMMEVIKAQHDTAIALRRAYWIAAASAILIYIACSFFHGYG